MTDNELRAVWRAAEASAGPFGRLVQFILLTAARRTEAAAMTWGELEEEWTLPACRNGTKVDLVRPLSAEAWAVLPAKVVGCGPPPMLQALTRLVAEHDIPCDLSLENHMACGFGACFSCVAPIQIAGQFRIRVTASSRGATAAATLNQTNAEPVASSHSKKIALVGLIAAGVAGGVLAGAMGGGNSTTGSSGSASPPPPGTPTPGSISAGAPSFGPPR